MRIAQLAPTFERVPPATYGGTELIVSLVTEELVRRGHRVTLYASGDSETAAELRSITPRAVRYGEIVDGVRHAEYFQLVNAQACFVDAEAGEFDIVHNHAGLEGLVLGATSSTPVLTTNHNPYLPAIAAGVGRVPVGPQLAVGRERARRSRPPAPSRRSSTGSTSSRSRSASGPAATSSSWAGSRPRRAPTGRSRRPACAGRRLVLAGKADAVDAAHFAEVIEPQIDGDLIRYVGEVDGAQKRQLLADARALLFPIEWDEPFGLVMIEAMACGTPVIGLRRASVPEVVDPGVTGFVVDDVEGLVRAIDHADGIDRRACRRRAEERFGVGRMVDDYERTFAEVIESAAGEREVRQPVG